MARFGAPRRTPGHVPDRERVLPHGYGPPNVKDLRRAQMRAGRIGTTSTATPPPSIATEQVSDDGNAYELNDDQAATAAGSCNLIADRISGRTRSSEWRIVEFVPGGNVTVEYDADAGEGVGLHGYSDTCTGVAPQVSYGGPVAADPAFQYTAAMASDVEYLVVTSEHHSETNPGRYAIWRRT